MLLDDAFYHVETWTGSYDPLPLSDLQLTQLTEYFLKHLDPHHTVPGAVYLQMQGEMSYYHDHGHLTHRQRRWLMHHIQAHITDVRII